MARSERITLRLTPEERERFEEEAAKEDLQLTPYLRRKLGLSNRRDIGEQGKGYEMPEQDKARIDPLPSSGEKFGRVLEPDGVNPKGFKRLVAQLQAKMTLPEAEAEARKRLGMES